MFAVTIIAMVTHVVLAVVKLSVGFEMFMLYSYAQIGRSLSLMSHQNVYIYDLMAHGMRGATFNIFGHFPCGHLTLCSHC